jgi:DNA invertase Pin-like site-specific DNA recombinase
MKTKLSTSQTLAYSYLRFSSPEQAKSDSIRRQTEVRDKWLAKSGATLDTSLTLNDAGVSGFKGKHRSDDRHALGLFLKMVKGGKIPSGSYLIVESLDRLSREDIQPALSLFLDLLASGIRIVQLLPCEQVFDRTSNAMAIMMAVMELNRGNSESAMKSERVGAAWKAKRDRAKMTGEVLTKRTPSWLRVANGRFMVDEKAADTVRIIFDLAANGYGLGAITKKLNADKVRPIGRANYWARSYVAKLLSSRAVIGECQPFRGHNAGRKPDGPPIPGYFPAIISEDKWHAVQAAMRSRKLTGGRPAKQGVNFFQGIWRDARDCGRLHLLNKGGNGADPLIVPYNGTNGVHGSTTSFPLWAFEQAILSRLREIDPAEILDTGNNDAAERVLSLTGKLGILDARIVALKAKLAGDGDIDSLVDVLKTVEKNRAEVAAELAASQREASTPLVAAWNESQTLLDALNKAPDPDEARTRLRAVLRRTVESIHCLFVASGSVRLAAVQVYFAGGAHRDYLIVYRGGHRNAASARGATVDVRDFKELKAGPLDFRHLRDVAKLSGTLTELAAKIAATNRRKKSKA